MNSIYIIGNWKMHLTRGEAIQLVQELKNQGRSYLSGNLKDLHIGVAPAFPFLEAVHQEIGESPILLGAQNVHEKDEGAFTGEVSPKMLQSMKCDFVILGHSERRKYFGERDELIHQKIAAALAFHLRPLLCVGESLEERERGEAEKVVEKQIRGALSGFSAPLLRNLLIAYEPVWAIGTGKAATPEDANQMHSFIQHLLQEMFDETFAAQIPLLYGGSVKPSNAKDLGAQPQIHGALVGGASLKAKDFVEIIKSFSLAKGF